MKQRGIGMMILLSIITLGIYTIYWQCSFQGQLKEKTGEGFGPIGHFLMCIVTFGIYSIYWSYAAGKRLAKLNAGDNSILYLVLTLVGFGWINMFLMQNEANKIA